MADKIPDFDASIRISDLGSEPTRSFRRPDLSETLRKVNGPQSGLERTLVDEQRKKSATLQQSLGAGSPRRPPPRTPLNKSSYDIDSSPLTSPENMASARVRLSKMISREKELMTNVKTEKHVDFVVNPQHVSKLAARINDLESNDTDSHRQQPPQSPFRKRSPLRNSTNGNQLSSSVRRRPPPLVLPAESISSSGPSDYNSVEWPSGESLFLGTSKFTSCVLQNIEDDDGIIDELGRFAHHVHDLGIVTVQLWKLDSAHGSGGASLFGTRYDGMQVSLGVGRTADIMSVCKSCGEISPVLLHGSQSWSSAESAMQLLMRQPRRNTCESYIDQGEDDIAPMDSHVAAPKRNWEKIIALAIPGPTTAFAGALLVAESKLSTKMVYVIQSLQRIAMAISWKWNIFTESRRKVDMNRLITTCTSRMEVAEVLSGKVISELSNPYDVASTAKTVAMLGHSVLKFKHAWCLLESQNELYQDGSHHGVDKDKWVSIFYGHSDSTRPHQQNPHAVLNNSRNHLLRQLFSSSSSSTVMRVSTMNLSLLELLNAGMLDESDRATYESLPNPNATGYMNASSTTISSADSQDIAFLVVSLIARPSPPQHSDYEGSDSSTPFEGSRCVLCLAMSSTDDIELKQSQAMMLATLATQAFAHACAATTARIYAQLDTVPHILLESIDSTANVTTTRSVFSSPQDDSTFPFQSRHSLRNLLSIIHSSSFAHRFFSSNAALLLCGGLYQQTMNESEKVQYGSNQGSFYCWSAEQSSVKVSDELSLLPVCCSGFASMTHLTLHHLSQFGWMKALKAGKAIIIHSMSALEKHGHESHSQQKTSGYGAHGVLITGDVERSYHDDAEINLSGSGGHMPNSCAALHDIIRSVKADASSAVIMPVFSAFGMCMLVLTDKLYRDDLRPLNICSHAKGTSSNSSDNTVIERKVKISVSNVIPGKVAVEKEELLIRYLPDEIDVVSASGVLKQIGTILNNCLVLQSSGNAHLESKQLQGHVETLSKIIQVRRRKTLTANYFKYWYSSALLTSGSLTQSANITSSAVTTYKECLVLREHNASLASELAVERLTNESNAGRLVATMNLLQFSQNTMDVTTTNALSDLIAESLPKLLCSESVVLLLAVDSVNVVGKSEVMFQRCLSKQPGDQIATAPLISMQQIRQIPLYVDVCDNDKNVRESVILLFGPSRDCYGILFVVHNDSYNKPFVPMSSVENDKSVGTASWKGIETLLTNSLASCIYSCVSRAKMTDSVEVIKGSLADMEVFGQENTQLRSQLSQITTKYEQLEESQQLIITKHGELVEEFENAKLHHQSEVHMLQCEQESQLGKKDIAIESYKENIQLLKKENCTLQRDFDIDNNFQSEMLDVINDFSGDSRCDSEDVVHWLTGAVERLQLKVFFISQNADGSLSTDTESAWGLKGVIPAAAEALRNNAPVQVETFYTDNSNSANSMIPKRSNFVASAIINNTSGSDMSEKVYLRCLPNKIANTNDPHSVKYACFVYVKSVSTGDFSAGELKLLECITSLTSSCLMRNLAKYDVSEIRQIEAERTALLNYAHKVREAVNLMEVAWKRGCKSKAELGKVLEENVSKLLQQVGSGDDQLFSVSCLLWYPSASSYSAASFNGVSGLEENMYNVMRQGHGTRKGCMLWHPLIAPNGDIICILQVEKRLIGDLKVAPVRLQSNSLKVSPPALEDLYVTKEDEDVVDVFCRLCMPLLDNVNVVHDAYNSIQQASQAIITLQQSKAVLEDNLALEVSQRLQIEDSLKVGAELLGAANSQRIDSSQLLDLTRKACMSVTSADECFVIFPKLPDTIVPISSSSSVATGVAPFDSPSVTNEHQEVDGHFISHFSSQRDEEYAGADAEVLYTLEADRPSPVHVRLETGDIEYIALLHCRSVIVPTPLEDNAAGFNVVSDHNLVNQGAPWHSWCVRRMQSGFHSLRTDHSHSSHSTNATGDEALYESNSNYFALVVPFALVDGGKTGVICLLRKAAPFVAVDRECTKWIGKVMSFCLHLKSVGVVSIGSGKEYQRRVSTMEREISQLAHDMGSSTVHEGAIGSVKLEGEGGRTVSAAAVAQSLAHQSLGDGVTVTCWDTIDEQCEAEFDFSLFAKSHRHSGTDETVHKINSLHGELLYAVVETGAGSTSAQPPASIHSINYRERNLISGNGRRSLFAILQCDFGSKVWLKLDFFGKERGLIRLRLVIFFKLFESQMKLKLELVSCASDHVQSVEALESRMLAMDKDRAEAFAFQKETTANAKDKYKVALNGKTKSLKSVQAAIMACWRFNMVQRRIPPLVHKWPTKSLFSLVEDEQPVPWANKVVMDLQLLYVYAVETHCSIVSSVFHDSLGFDISVTALLPRCGTLVTICSSTADGSKAKENTDFWKRYFEKPISFGAASASVNNLTASFNKAGNNVPFAFAAFSKDGTSIHNELLANKIVVIMNSPDLRNRTNMLGEEQQEVKLTSGTSNYFCHKETYSTLKETLPSHSFLESSTYPDGTLLVPIQLPPLQQSESTVQGAFLIICIAPPHSESDGTGIAERNKKQKKQRIVHYTELTCLDNFRRNFLLSLSDQLRSHQAKVDDIKTSLLKGLAHLGSVIDKKKNVEISAAFERLKANVTESKLHRVISRSPSGQHMKYLEQLLADWTELVKGVNGAVSGISSGVSGLWVRSCGSFMSMISSHITLKGCGLLIANQDGEMVELTVRELSTPGSFERGDAASPDGYIAKGVIDVRPGAELGRRVQQLAWDLLNDNAAAGGESQQRVWKLSKKVEHSNAEEQLWLSPVRSSHNVMAVLRVSVEPFAMDLSNYADETFNSSIADSNNSIRMNKRDHLAEYRDEAALRCFTNFADIFACLVASARMIDGVRTKEVEQEDMIQKAVVKQRFSTIELTATMKKLAVLTSAISVCYKASHIRDRHEQDLMASDGQARSVATRMSHLVSHSAKALAKRLSGVMLGAKVNIELNEADTLESPEPKPHQNTNLYSSHHLINESQDIFGTVFVFFDDQHNRTYGGFGESQMTEDLSLQSPIIESPSRRRRGRNDSFREEVEAVPYKEDDMSSDRSIIVSILPPLCESISIYLCAERRDVESTLQLSHSSQSVEFLEQEFSTAQQALNDFQRDQASTRSSINLYSTIADIANQCLNHTSFLGSEQLDVSANVQYQEMSGPKTISDSVDRLLGYVGSKLLPLFVGNCQEHGNEENVCVRFGLVPNAVVRVEGVGGGDKLSNLSWISTSSHDAADTGLFGSSKKSKSRSENSFEIATNVAFSSISKRAYASVDVGSSNDDEPNSLPITTHVTCFPLICGPDSQAIGVLQILADSSSPNVDHSSHKQFDNLCADVAQSVANTLHILQQKYELLSERERNSKDFILLQADQVATASKASLERSHAGVWKSALACVSEIFASCGRVVQIMYANSFRPKADQHTLGTAAAVLEGNSNVVNGLFLRSGADIFQDAIVLAENIISDILFNSPISLTVRVLRSSTQNGTTEELEELVLPLCSSTDKPLVNVVAVDRVSIDMLSDADGNGAGDRYVDIKYLSMDADVSEDESAMGAEVVNYLHNNIITILNIIKDRNKAVDDVWTQKLVLSDNILQLEENCSELQKQMEVCESSKERTDHMNNMLLRQCAIATVSSPLQMANGLLKPTLLESKYFLNAVLDKHRGSGGDFGSLWSMMCACLYRTLGHMYNGHAAFHVSIVSFNMIHESVSVYDHGVKYSSSKSEEFFSASRSSAQATVSNRDEERENPDPYFQMKLNSVSKTNNSNSALLQCFRSDEVIEQVEYLHGDYVSGESVDLMGISSDCLSAIGKPKTEAKHDNTDTTSRSVTLLCIPFSINGVQPSSDVMSEVKTAVRIVLPTIIPPSATELHDQMMTLLRSDVQMATELFDNCTFPTSIISKSMQLLTSYVSMMVSKMLQLGASTNASGVDGGKHLEDMHVIENTKDHRLNRSVLATSSRSASPSSIHSRQQRSKRDSSAHGSSSKDIHSYPHEESKSRSSSRRDGSRERFEKEKESEDLIRCRRLYRVICREVCGLLDPPMVGIEGSEARSVHPSSLSPLLASQDTCLKTLNILRTLVRGEGQAILMKNSTSIPVSYQVIYTGDALAWKGIDQGCFGTVSSSGGLSLVETSISSHKTVHMLSASADPRYCAALDGICDEACPYLVIPLRGRGGSVVGAVLVARGAGGTAFSSEDIIAAEMVATFTSVSLYWCQGLGALHHSLVKQTNRIERLENTIHLHQVKEAE